MPAKRLPKSIHWPNVYEALKAKGYSKTKSAKISNAAFNKYKPAKSKTRVTSKTRRKMKRAGVK